VDDIVLVACNLDFIIKMFNTLEEKSRIVGLTHTINEGKTKYMNMSASEARKGTQSATFGQYNFESVKNFSYLGSVLNNENWVTEEINRWIMAGHRAYFTNVKLLKSTLLSRHSKVKIYRTLFRPVVTYGLEKWTMSAADENALRVFERKVLRRIYGPVREGERWRIRSNRELEEILKGEDIVRFVKSRWLAWLGHVEQMDEERMPRKLLHGRTEGRRRLGRPKKGWLQSLEEDLRIMWVRRWWEKVGCREERGSVVREAKAHSRLQRRGRRRRLLARQCFSPLHHSCTQVSEQHVWQDSNKYTQVE
jgi:hypothetical protein